MSKEDIECLKTIIKRYDKIEQERCSIVEQISNLEIKEEAVVEKKDALEQVIVSLMSIEFSDYTCEPCFFDINRVKKILGAK